MEIFKDIVGYEGLYQVSNMGRVKRLPREIENGTGYFICKEKILDPSKDAKGYFATCLRKNNQGKVHKIHQLVAIAFLNHTPCGMKLVIDHRNDIKTDNRVDNLQLVTNRENTSKDKKNKTSKYKGVSWHKPTQKWVAQIYIDGKAFNLGYFEKEYDASVVYQNKLLSLNN